jgi:hypothetical protein
MFDVFIAEMLKKTAGSKEPVDRIRRRVNRTNNQRRLHPG